MNAERNNYLAHLTTSVAKLLTDIVAERTSYPIFRRSPQVTLSQGVGAQSGYQLAVSRHEIVGEPTGTFTVVAPNSGALVFRSPARMKTMFQLSNGSLGAEQRLEAYDQLTSWFFDNRSVDPFLPESFRRHPALFDRLCNTKAELRMVDATPAPLARDTFVFSFEYVGLYHSGNPLREEQRVQTRTIHFPSENRDRSMS